MFVLGQTFYPSLIFVGNASHLKCGAPERCLTHVSFSFTCKHPTRLERVASGKHSSFLATLVNCGHIKFLNIGPVVSVINVTAVMYDWA
jgi:L-asparaginase II